MKRCVAIFFAFACCIAACWMFSGQARAAGQTSDYQAQAALNRTGWNLPAAFNYAMVEHYAQRPHHWSVSYYANDGF